VVPPQARVPGLQISQNSVKVPQAEWGAARPVDPGYFVIEARAPGRRTYRSQFSLKNDAATHNLTIPVLVVEAATPAAPTESGGSASRAQWLERGGVGLASLGVVGLTVGTVFGVRAVNRYHRSRDEGCDDDDVCTPGALETRQSAVRNGNVSTMSFVIGGALLASGAGLYVWGSRERAAEQAGLRARVTPLQGGGFAELTSRF
jgi:hypothetical protein